MAKEKEWVVAIGDVLDGCQIFVTTDPYNLSNESEICAIIGVRDDPVDILVLQIVDLKYLERESKCTDGSVYKGANLVCGIIQASLEEFPKRKVDIRLNEGDSLPTSTIDLIKRLVKGEAFNLIHVNGIKIQDYEKTLKGEKAETKGEKAETITNNSSSKVGDMFLGAALLATIDLAYNYLSHSCLPTANPLIITKCTLIVGSLLYIASQCFKGPEDYIGIR
ncbi:MAG: hypothetical protein K0R73_338 [Candidatus Midichloriaceae bacterium]|jgi:hypothetical protein|nr:hypothetical protein [Candidatus Midichloriaceae bacterium]